MTDNEREFEDFVHDIRFDDTPGPNHRNELEQDILSALTKQSRQKQQPARTLRIILKSRITRVAAAVVIIVAVMIGMSEFGGPVDVTSVSFAEIKNAVNKMPLMHKVIDTNSNGHQHYTENWYCFESKSVLSKHASNGKCHKISSLDYNTMENVVYDPNSEVVKVLYRVDVDPTSLHASPWAVLEDYIKDYERQGALIDREKRQFEGKNVDVYYLTIPSNFREEKVEVELLVNRSSHLPVLYKRKFWTPQGRLRFDQVIRFGFPENGPKDIYDLGVARATRVVHDLESKERLEKKRQLLQEKLIYEERFQRVYRLNEGEVLRHIRPSPELRLRVKLDEISRSIEQLEREGSQIMPRMATGEKEEKDKECYYMHYWNGETLAEWGRSVFRDGVTLEIALKRIIALPEFEYDDIPESLVGIRIPGDWVVRNGAPKEQLLKASEKVLQDFTKRQIQFEKRQVERDVIVVRGKFRFESLTGTYDDNWIHVFSDKLDPDEGGGGGTCSLDSFLTQRLAETQLKQHVVNLTESSDDIRVKYGCHTSAYLGKIALGPERDAKLDRLLANLARQTSLTFTKELRKVNIWYIVQDD